jgi:hypothetical protein
MYATWKTSTRGFLMVHSIGLNLEDRFLLDLDALQPFAVFSASLGYGRRMQQQKSEWSGEWRVDGVECPWKAGGLLAFL